MGLYSLRIGLAHKMGGNFNRLTGFEVLEQSRLRDFGFQFAGIQYLKKNDIMALKSQWPDVGNDFFGIAVEIRYDSDQSAAADMFPEPLERFVQRN